MNITLEGLRLAFDMGRWTDDASGQAVLLALAGVMALAFLLVYGPLTVRWIRTATLDWKLRALAKHTPETPERNFDAWNRAFEGSPAELQWNELRNHWITSRTAPKEEFDPSPTSMAAVLVRWPLLPRGLRRTFLESLPGLFILMGMAGALFSLSSAVNMQSEQAGTLTIADLAAIALGPALWGLGLALLTSVVSRFFHGVFENHSESIDRNALQAFTDFRAENPIGIEDEAVATTPPTQDTSLPVTEIEATHIAHLQLNNVTRQMSSLINHLHESGFALRNAASALRSTQSRVENNSEEIRISLKQAASTIVDQGGFIQMSLDQIRKTLGDSAAPKQSAQVSAQALPVENIVLEAAIPIASESVPSRAGRRLGPDPYARKEAEEQNDSKKVEKLVEHHELEGSLGSARKTVRSESSQATSGKLSDLLARTHDSTERGFSASLKSAGTRKRGSAATSSPAHGDSGSTRRSATQAD